MKTLNEELGRMKMMMELHDLNDFSLQKLKNHLKEVLAQGGISLNDIDPDTYFLLALDNKSKRIGIRVTASKEECQSFIREYQAMPRTHMILVEKPSVAFSTYRRENGIWSTKSHIYSDPKFKSPYH